MVVVIPAAPVHVDEAARVLAGTFRDDAVMSGLVGGAGAGREHRLTHLFRALVRRGVRHGVVDLARAEGDPAVLGVAIWSPPGRGAEGLLDLLRDLGSYVRALGVGGLRTGAAFDRRLHASRPGEPHWYLGAIGSHASGRGRGVGSALLGTRLRVVDRAAAPAYLEASTERSAALYARFGFVPTGRVAGFGATAAPIAMWRPGSTDRDPAGRP